VVNASRPDMSLQVAFNVDPNDPAAPAAVWSDLTSLFLGADAVDRGRQYELDQTRAAQPSLSFMDPNENLNPDNPSSPFAPNVVPYRKVNWQALWPNTTSGNLLNLGTQIPGPIDPSFESYTVGVTPTWFTQFGISGASVQAANPHGGTKSLQYTIASGATQRGIFVTVFCMPGRQYTASCWVRQTTASTQVITITGVATGTSTTTTGAYVRLSVTFTATQPQHTLYIGTTGTAIAGTVNLDDVQLEQGAAATANITTGPVIYNVLSDLVERWPSRWDPDAQGFLGLCDATCVDAFAALQANDLHTEYDSAVYAKAPDYYWKLSEAQGAAIFLDSSGNNRTPLTRTDGTFGAGPTFAPGTQMNIPGDPSGTGLATDQPATGFLNLPVTVATSDLFAIKNPVSIGSTGNTYGITVSAWIIHTPIPATSDQRIFLLISSPLSSTLFQVVWEVSYPNLLFGANFGAVTFADNYADGKPHLFTHTIFAAGGNVTNTVWVDGVQVGTNTVAWSAIPLGTVAQIGGAVNPSVGGGNYHPTAAGLNGGVYGRYAVWNRVLSNGEIADLWAAGRGYPGETSGQRIARYLTASYIGPTIVDTGSSVMGASVLADGTSALDACQAVTTTENGNFWVDGDGNLTFAGRARRYLATTPVYVFGENAAGGELPYEGDVEFGLDPTLVYNDVAVTNAGGVVAHAADSASQKRYFKQSYPRDVNVLSDLEAVDAANYLLNQHKVPRVRVQTITLDPGSVPALWPVVLGIEVGTRVTVKRRSKAANGGAGLTQSRDFFVEQISHGGINFEAGTWTTTLQLSPVDFSQVWILGDATYSVLGTTTVLGY